MPVKINLIPHELLIGKNLGGVLKTLRALNVILSIAFLIFVLGVGTFLLISKSSLSSTEKKVDQLKIQILAQQSSEQRLILLKDRLAKISLIMKSPSILKSITKVNSLFVDLSESSSIDAMNIGSGKIEISMTIQSNEDLTKFIKNIKNTNTFKSIILTSFGYGPLNGYVLGVSISGD